MRTTPRILLPACLVVLVVLTASAAQAAVPSQSSDDTAMVDGTTARVRAVTETAGGRVWVAGDFSEVDTSTGAVLRSVSDLAAFTPSGALDTAVSIPAVTLTGGGSIVYDMSLAPDGVLYLAGNFDSVGGLPRNNVAAIDPDTGTVLPFAPNVAAANAVYATSTAVYVGTGKLLSFQPNGVKTPGWTDPVAIIDAGIRAHTTIPQFRDLTVAGNTVVAACQCDSVNDGNGTSLTKAVVEIDASTGNLRNWAPGNLASTSAAFGISVIVRNGVVYLGAGGSDFTAAYDFGTGAQLWKTDTSGSTQAVAWYQNTLIIGGHFDWVEKVGGPASCGDNATPDTGCWHAPKLTSLVPASGVVNLVSGVPWNPGICCKYNGVWALTPDADGSTLHVGGEFEKVGGTWTGSGTNWSLTGASLQRYYARLSGPAPTTQPLNLTKLGSGTGSVSSTPGGITCGTSCTTASGAFNAGSSVTLAATADPGFTFTGWDGDCSGTGSCSVTMSAVRNVSATFAPISYQLNVSKTGAGTGTITSDVPGIDCGASCSAFFVHDTVVTLTAAAGANSSFTGWSAAGCSGTGTCVVRMDAAKSVTAGFSSTTHALTVTKSGAGAGTITSSPAGISCGGNITTGCSTKTANFSAGVVTLTASAASGSIFNGWSGGGCDGLALTCDVTMDTDKTVNAEFAKARNVNLTFAGTGGGRVTSVPAGLDCTASCVKSFVENSTVTLTATPDPTSAFAGWSGTGGCTGTAPCTLVMSGGRAVTATFQPGNMLTIAPAGAGTGTVTSDVGGIDCGLTCSANYLPGATVTLTATPDANATFTGWSGGSCSGTGTCVVTMNAGQTVTATFGLAQRQLTVGVVGQGTVTDNPGPISCPGTCTANYDDGTDVQLAAIASSGFTFTGWSGDCAGSDTTCIVSMTAARSVTATFEANAGTLVVTKAGSGTGGVTSSPAGIDCGSDCVEGYPSGTPVSLTAVADPGSVFTGWSGDCSGTGACDLTMNSAQSVTADFELLHQLSVTVTGDGTVTSDVGSISCPGSCTSTQLAHGSVVQLTASPGVGSSFLGWSGGGCSGTALTCDVTLDADTSVTATFGTPETLTVSVTGSGGVTSSPTGIDCPATSCDHQFAQGTVVTLSAAAAPGSSFTGWSGACTNISGDCVVTMDGATSVGATFAVTRETLTVGTGGSGTGTVTSDTGGISCPGVCQVDYDYGTVVTLTAAPTAGMTFTGWSGDCTNLSGTCQVTMDVARTVTATFASGPATCGKIAFVSNRTGNPDVYTMNADGTSPTNVTARGGKDIDPAWSPDCSKIAFSSARAGTDDIWVMNANGTGLVQLTSGGGSDTQPTWSPDGTKIAFVSTRDPDADQEIFTMSASNGSGVTQLTFDTVIDTAPDWSPDGTKIAFMSKRSGTQIWVMNADGSSQTKRTSNLKACDTPAWSPDGTKIAFVSTMSGSKQVWVANASGTLGAVRITSDGVTDTNPTWSPDGTQIAYSGNASGNNEIWTIASGGGTSVNRTNNAKSETSPNWFP